MEGMPDEIEASTYHSSTDVPMLQILYSGDQCEATLTHSTAACCRAAIYLYSELFRNKVAHYSDKNLLCKNFK